MPGAVWRRLRTPGSEAEAAEVWNPDVQGHIERAMMATNLPYAADVWRRTRGAIDAYMAGWTAMHRQTCQATRIDGHQSEQVMTVRMACLGQRREEVGALTKVLESADGDVVAKAAQAAMALPSIETCKDVTSLLSVEPEPGDSATRSELDSIRKSLAAVRAEYEAGKYAPARSEAALLVERARRIGYHPVTAEALLWLAQSMSRVGVPRAQCIERSEEAVVAADSGRDDLLRAAAASKTTALGDEHPARLTSLNNRAYIAGQSFDYQTAGAFSVQAVRLGEKVAPGDLQTNIARLNACDSLAHKGGSRGGPSLLQTGDRGNAESAGA
jgi:hypothetical protein